MNLPLSPLGATLQGLTNYLRTLITSIQAGWRVNHADDGTHSSFTWSGETQTTVGAAGSATALPANPTGYKVEKLSDGTEIVIPYYAKS
jgi:hypothetical protein